MINFVKKTLIGLVVFSSVELLFSCGNIKVEYEGYDDYDDKVTVYYCKSEKDLFSFFKSQNSNTKSMNEWNEFLNEEKEYYSELDGDSFFTDDFFGRKIKDEIKEGFYIVKREDRDDNSYILGYVTFKENDFTWKELFNENGYYDGYREEYKALANWPFPFDKETWYTVFSNEANLPYKEYENKTTEEFRNKYKKNYQETKNSDKKYRCKYIDKEKSWKIFLYDSDMIE